MKAIEGKLDYTFRDQELLVNALTHSSYANENRGHSCESNERLEFLATRCSASWWRMRSTAANRSCPRGA